MTHEVQVTFMAEVCTILNWRPIAAIDSESSSPMVLSPNILLTQKQGEIGTLSENLGIKDMYSVSWKQVQFCRISSGKSGARLIWTVCIRNTNGLQVNQI